MAVGEESKLFAFKLLTEFRRKNILVDMDFSDRSMKAQMKQASKSNAKFAVIIGEDELKNNEVTLKNLETSEQKKYSVEKILERIDL